MFADIASLERNFVKFLLINLVLGLSQEKVLKNCGSPLGRAGPRPQSGASFAAFSTVSCPSSSSLAGSVGPHAAARSGSLLFDEECRQDPEFLNRVLGLERMLRVKASFSGSETVPVSKVSGAVPGISVLDDGMDGTCSAPRALPGAEDTLVYHVHDFDDCFNDADSALGVRDQPARLGAGENEGTTGLLEVREPDLRMRPVTVVASATAGEREGIIGFRGFDSSLCMPINSLNSSGSVDADACARVVAALPAAAAVASCVGTSLALRSSASVAQRLSLPCIPIRGRTRIGFQGPTGRKRVKGGVYGGRLQVSVPGGNQAQVPGV